MKPWLLSFLLCPQCRSSLKLDSVTEKEGEILSGTLRCTCGINYSICNGIPRFTSSKGEYVRIYAEMEKSCSRYPFVPGNQLRQIYTVEEWTQKQFELQTNGLPLEKLRGKLILDVGCGGGRFLKLFHKAGARVIGVDLLSQRVEQSLCFLKEGGITEVALVQGDIFALPFQDRVFDFVFSNGVLHHTPDPKAAFAKLTQLAKPGGLLSIWVYSLERPLQRLRAFPSAITSRLPILLLIGICLPLVLLKPLVYRQDGKPRKVLGHLRWLLFIPWHPDWRWRLQSVLDYWGPRYQWRYKTQQVLEWFQEAGLINLQVGAYPVSVTGQAS